MPEILLYNEDITVVGSPETVVVQTDFGPTGTRGSQIFVTDGKPNTTPIGQTPLLNDLCINIASGSEYTDLYQYVAQPGQNVWTKLFTIQDPGTGTTDEYVAIQQIAFTNGQATLTIPLSSIAPSLPPTVTENNFSCQISIDGGMPSFPIILSSFYIQPMVSPATALNISLMGASFDPYGYGNSPLNGTYKVHIAIWVVGV